MYWTYFAVYVLGVEDTRYEINGMGYAAFGASMPRGKGKNWCRMPVSSRCVLRGFGQ